MLLARANVAVSFRCVPEAACQQEEQIDMSYQLYSRLCDTDLYRNPRGLSCLLFFVLLILSGCTLSRDILLADHAQAAILISIQISPSDVDLPLGLTQQFTATGLFSDGSAQDMTNLATWNSSSPPVARINSNGLTMSAGTGVSSITATTGSVTAHAFVMVRPATLESELHEPLREQYIWSSTRESGTVVRYFRALFDVQAIPAKATLYIGGPGSIVAYLNGKLVANTQASTGALTMPLVAVADVSATLQRGMNLLAVACSNGESMVAKIVPALPSVNVSPLMISGSNWKVTTIREIGWELPIHEDGNWTSANALGGIEADPERFNGGRDSEMYRWSGYDGISPFLARKTSNALAVERVAEGAGEFFNLQAVTKPVAREGFSVRIPQSAHIDSDYPSFVLDFGRETNGRLEIESDSPDIAKIQVQYGESIEEALLQPFYGKNELTVPPRVTVYGPKAGFRFAQVKFVSGPAILNLKKLCIDEIYYPAGFRGFFNSSDLLLNRIWAVGARTAQLTMQEGIWDGIKRDRLKWSGDFYVSGRVIHSVFGDRVLTQKTIDFLGSQSLGPRGDVNNIPGYSAFWVMTLSDYFRRSGDVTFLLNHKTELIAVLDSMKNSIDARGLIFFDPSVFPFVDWSPDLFTDTPESRMATQFAFFKAFMDGAWLLDQLGNALEARTVRAWADIVRSAAQSLLLDTGLNTFGTRWQTNAMATFSRITTPTQDEAIWQNVLSTPPQAEVTPYYNYFVITAMAQTGRRKQALDWIRAYWGGMLSEGATTFWEAYDLSWPKDDFHAFLKADRTQGYYVSLCHGWSSGPTAWLMEQVLGIQPVAAGFSEVVIRPDLADLKWVQGSEPTPTGDISVEYRVLDGLQGTVSLPGGVQVFLSLPVKAGQTSVIINGALTRGIPSEANARLVVVLSSSGIYHFSTQSSDKAVP
jgi:alpha-L-rhamnosidase